MRRSTLRLYGPFLALALVQALIIVTAPSKAPDRTALSAGGLQSGKGASGGTGFTAGTGGTGTPGATNGGTGVPGATGDSGGGGGNVVSNVGGGTLAAG